MTNVTKNSHYIPNFHLKKWMQINASIFDKANEKCIRLITIITVFYNEIGSFRRCRKSPLFLQSLFSLIFPNL